MTDKTTNYAEYRERMEERFKELSPVDGSAVHHTSPSGRFSLEVSTYGTDDGGWNYSRGIVKKSGSSEVIADVKRNYGHFWYSWVVQGQAEYLLCGEDYQGYNVIDPDSGANSLIFPPEAFDGKGFCWAAAYPSPDGKTLAVEGCYWGGWYELVFYDFSEPMKSPLPELKRFLYLDKAGSWASNTEFSFLAFEDEEENPPSQSIVWHRDFAHEL